MIKVDEIIQEITSLYLSQLPIYQQIYDLTKDQFRLLEQEKNAEDLVKIFGKRFALLGNLDQPNIQLEELKNTVKEALMIEEFRMGLLKEKVKNKDILLELDKALVELGDLIKSINDLDDEFRAKVDTSGNINRIRVQPNQTKVQQAYKTFMPAKTNENDK